MSQAQGAAITLPYAAGTQRRFSSSQVIVAALLATLIVLCIIAIKSRAAVRIAIDPLLFGYTIFVTAFQLFRLLSATFYRSTYAKLVDEAPRALLYPPTAAHDGEIARATNRGAAAELRMPGYEPTVSFVIPCKNEEGAIRKTVTQCFRADYPSEKLEVIVINDGSTDRTGEILTELQEEYPKLIVVTWEKNRGKRHGMAEGFRRANGELVVQLDSDSYIVPETFRQVITPFRNPAIGAVSYHSDPENADENIMTKMQAAYYFMSFRILKAAESAYGVVFCCSGCASTYRKSIVLPILDQWLNEMFLGLPVTWGDDRALTNYVLRSGFHTLYSDHALAYTIVPSTFRGFVRQQIRWKKGWFVNSIFASRFIWRTDPFVAFSYFFPLTAVTLLTPFVATRALFYSLTTHDPISIALYMSGIFLVAALIVVYYRTVAPSNGYWPYLFLWAAINMAILSFLLYYALATIQNRKWVTR